MNAINACRAVPILPRQVEYRNNIAEQDHRAIKRVNKPNLHFQSFRAAGSVPDGIELIYIIRKNQFAINDTEADSFVEQFSMLAGMLRSAWAAHAWSGKISLSTNNATAPLRAPTGLGKFIEFVTLRPEDCTLSFIMLSSMPNVQFARSA